MKNNQREKLKKLLNDFEKDLSKLISVRNSKIIPLEKSIQDLGEFKCYKLSKDAKEIERLKNLISKKKNASENEACICGEEIFREYFCQFCEIMNEEN